MATATTTVVTDPAEAAAKAEAAVALAAEEGTPEALAAAEEATAEALRVAKEASAAEDVGQSATGDGSGSAVSDGGAGQEEAAPTQSPTRMEACFWAIRATAGPNMGLISK